MNKKLIATIFSTALVISPLPAFTADSSAPAPKNAQAAGPLAPGKAAGVQQAQGNGLDDTDVLWGAAIATGVGLGIYALTSNNGSGGGGAAPTPTPVTTTTTTTTP